MRSVPKSNRLELSQGGGVYANASQLHLHKSVLLHNVADEGGAIWWKCKGYADVSCNRTSIRWTRFERNRASGGACVYEAGAGTVGFFQNSSFGNYLDANEADYGNGNQVDGQGLCVTGTSCVPSCLVLHHVL